MGKPIPLKSLKDLAESKPVLEASTLLDNRHRKSVEAILEAADRMERLTSDDEKSKSSLSSSHGLSSHGLSSSASDIVLIVEHCTERSLLRQIVDKSGWQVVAVKCSDDALRLLKMRNWGVVFIDNDLPLFSGSSCIVRFREWEKRSRVVRQKHIYLLADTFDPHSLQSGVDGTLGKPVDPVHLSQILEAAAKETFKCSREILIR
jgi:PleD family two-component response regulator